MKKIKNLVVGGIQHKIFNVFLITLVLVVGGYTMIIMLQSRELSSIVENANVRQQESVGAISGETIEDMVDSSLIRSVQQEADIADDVFRDLLSTVMVLGDCAQKLYDDPSSYPVQMADLPDASNAGTAAAQLIYDHGVDIRDQDTGREIGLIGNLSDIMLSLYKNSGQINSCFIASAKGVTIIADDRSDEKFTDEGKLIHPLVSKRPWYRGAKASGKLYFSEVEKDYFTDNIGIVCALPVYRDDKLVCVVGADLFLNSMADTVAASDDGSGFAFIVNQQGHVLFSPQKEGSFMVRTSAMARDLRQFGNEELAQFITDALNGKTDVRMIEADGTGYYMAGAPIPAVGWAYVSAVSKDAIMQPSRQMQEELSRISGEAAAVYEEGFDAAKKTIIVMMAVIFILGSAGVVLLGNRIVKPLETMKNRVAALKNGSLDFEMEDVFRTNDEIQVLAEAFDDLSKRNKRYIAEVTKVTAEKERIGAELNVASQIQEGMLPSIFPPFPNRSEFDICASMHPAKEVGGDFYDFFLIDDDHLALVMADVSGKGVPAALFMMSSRILINNYAIMNSSSPALILEKVNHQICLNNKVDMFVTAWLGILEISTGKIRAANAGHEYPAVYRKGGRYEILKDKHGFVLGGMDGVRYKDYEISLDPGDALFLYTDGVPEAADGDNTLFGTERMLDALNHALSEDCRGILNTVTGAIGEFVAGADQFDDITMLSLRYLGDDMKKLTIEAKTENLATVLSFINDELEKADCPVKTQMQIDIAVEEIFVNIASYAYAPDTGSAVIGIEILTDPKRAVITFADSGMPYDPLEREDPDVTLSAEEREIGGLGIFMVRQSMDSMEYEYRNGQNLLTVKKNLF